MCAFALSDHSEQRIPNELIILSAAAAPVCVGLSFLPRFCAALLAVSLLPVRRAGGPRIGGVDLKVAALLFAWCGMTRALHILLFSLVLASVYGIAARRSRIPLAVFLPGGFICAELLRS